MGESNKGSIGRMKSWQDAQHSNNTSNSNNTAFLSPPAASISAPNLRYILILSLSLFLSISPLPPSPFLSICIHLSILLSCRIMSNHIFLVLIGFSPRLNNRKGWIENPIKEMQLSSPQFTMHVNKTTTKIKTH